MSASAFLLTLADGSLADGRLYLPQHTTLSAVPERKPLLVTVPGGSYTADFFDVDEKHSIRPVCDRLGLPVLALNRPGYGATPGIKTADKLRDSFIQQSGRWLHSLALPAIWKEYAIKFGVSSLVLYGHSIGGAVCVVAAAEFEKDKKGTGYKLAGLAMSGLGCQPTVNDFNSFFEAEHRAEGPTAVQALSFPSDQQEAFMLGPLPKLYDAAVLEHTDRLRNNIYLQELYDIEFLWPTYCSSYASSINVAVLYNPGQCDRLWVIDSDTIRKMGEGFSNAPCVYAAASPNAPHAIELSHQSTGFYIKLFGFAVECAAQLEIASADE